MCVCRIFVDNEEEVDNITYANWLLLLVSGVEKALEMYQPKTELWLQVCLLAIFLFIVFVFEFGSSFFWKNFFFLQAHCQARFVIARVLLEAGEELVKVTEVVPDEKLLITLNRSKLQTEGAKAIKNFLLKLQVSRRILFSNSTWKSKRKRRIDTKIQNTFVGRECFQFLEWKNKNK